MTLPIMPNIGAQPVVVNSFIVTLGSLNLTLRSATWNPFLSLWGNLPSQRHSHEFWDAFLEYWDALWIRRSAGALK